MAIGVSANQGTQGTERPVQVQISVSPVKIPVVLVKNAPLSKLPTTGASLRVHTNASVAEDYRIFLEFFYEEKLKFQSK